MRTFFFISISCYLLIFKVFLFSSPVKSSQLSLLQKIEEQNQSCQPAYFFSSKELSSKQRYSYFNEKLQQIVDKNSKVGPSFNQSLNLIPVNRCILRGNRNFKGASQVETLQAYLKVKLLINTDSIVNQLVQRDNYFQKKLKEDPQLEYKYFPLSSNRYPSKEEKILIVKVLELLSEARQSKRIYLSCFFGKHRTGLISGLYQFLSAYSLNPSVTCSKLGTQEDEIYSQMNKIADLGFFTYKMPLALQEFYSDFAKAVCEKKSQEFIFSREGKQVHKSKESLD